MELPDGGEASEEDGNGEDTIAEVAGGAVFVTDGWFRVTGSGEAERSRLQATRAQTIQEQRREERQEINKAP